MASPLPDSLAARLHSAGSLVVGLQALLRAGVITPVRPDRLLGMGLALARWRISPATGYAVLAARHPDATAIVDDDGSRTFGEVHRSSNAVANGLRGLGVRPGDAVALLARNSADFVLAQVAASKAGADLIYLNTGFGAPQAADVLDAEQVSVVVADAEFAELLTETARDRDVVFIGHEGAEVPSGATTLEELAAGDDSDPPATGRDGRHVILTSGTTGHPKGAARSAPGPASGLEPIAAVLSRIPLRARQTTVLCAPMFHAWGFGHLSLAMLLGSTLVVSRRFDPTRVLQQIERHGAQALAVVPVMMQRMLELPEEQRRSHDTSSLRVVAVSGSALSTELAQRFMDEFGEVIYDLYGSTEVAYTSVATPRDIREVPGTVGRPLYGVQIRIVDDQFNDVVPGEIGRLYVGNSLTFAGYTGGEDKERLGALVATGDLARLDEKGRLFIEGRSDDMIVSGGENVYPGEVEESLLGHPGIVEAAVVGAPDEKFGQRLVAHVVAKGDAQPSADELRAHVKRALASYKVPREIVFHESLPRNETGKVLKRELQSADRPDGS
jgi:fatty-acyl-CoA synthase